MVEDDGDVGIKTRGRLFKRGDSKFKVVKTAEETEMTVAEAPVALEKGEYIDPIWFPEPALRLPPPVAPTIDLENKALTRFEDLDKANKMALIEAFVDGETVQYYDFILEEWMNTGRPCFAKHSAYRIKPKLTPAQQRVLELKAEIEAIEAGI